MHFVQLNVCFTSTAKLCEEGFKKSLLLFPAVSVGVVAEIVLFQLFDPTEYFMQQRDVLALSLPELPKALPLEAVLALAAHYTKK